MKFKQHGKGDEYKKILDTAKVDHADQITDEKIATEVLFKLATKYKSLKIENGALTQSIKK